MSITISSLLRHIHRKLGTSHFEIPIDEEEIIDIIQQESLYTYSKFYPHFVRTTISIDDLIEHRTSSSMYRIPNPTSLQIIGISRRIDNGRIGLYNNVFPAVSVMDPITTQAAMDLISGSVVPKTFRYEPPDKIELFPRRLFMEKEMIEIKCIHKPDLSTITVNMKDEFFELCLLDVKDSIWQILKRKTDINSPFGTINLKIDDYAEAENQKKELLERWRRNFMKSSRRKWVVIA